MSDNGSQFTSTEFQAFMKGNGIKHISSSPYNPATNGLAERAVQSFKGHMKRFSSGTLQERLAQFLFWYRLTPHSTTAVPPAELLLGRRPRSKLHFLKPNLQKKVEDKTAVQKKHHDIHTGARSFNVGDSVNIKDFPDQKKWVPGTIVQTRGPLSYHVELDAVRSRVSDEGSSTSDVEIPSPEIAPAVVDSPAEEDVAEEDVDATPLSRIRRSDRSRPPPEYYGFQSSTPLT